jgi:hypothetical protein
MHTAMAGMHDPGWQGSGQERHQICPVKPELPVLGIERFPRHNGPVRREEAELGQPRCAPANLLEQAEPIQDSLTVAVQRKSCADVAQLGRLLIDPNLRPNLAKRHGCGQTPDTAADDCNS